MRHLSAEPFADPSSLTCASGAAVWWLGQAGILIAQRRLAHRDRRYLSDSLAEKYKGQRFAHERMMPPPVTPDELCNIDWVLCTHAHTDHMDPGTLPGVLAANRAAVFWAPVPRRPRPSRAACRRSGWC